MPESTAKQAVAENIAAHDRVASRYEKKHLEIFNPIEQERLAHDLGEAIGAIQTGRTPPRALDFGCGSGNLTRRLRELGCEVTAADVSPKFIEQLRREPGVTTFQLNGENLEGLPDAGFDAVATYSVLHHVPDYLAAVAELARVVAPGGVLYIDHEVSPEYWEPSDSLREYRRLTAPQQPPPPKASRFLNPATYVRKIKECLDPGLRRRRRMRQANPRWCEEGDIHVWPDDHIEWDQIAALLDERGFELVFRKDHLHYDARRTSGSSSTSAAATCVYWPCAERIAEADQDKKLAESPLWPCLPAGGVTIDADS